MGDTEREARCTSQLWGGRDQQFPGFTAQLPLPIWRISDNERPSLQTRWMQSEEQHRRAYSVVRYPAYLHKHENIHKPYMCILRHIAHPHRHVHPHPCHTHVLQCAHTAGTPSHASYTMHTYTQELEQVPNKLH